MSSVREKYTAKKKALLEKRAKHVANLKATGEAITAIDARIAICDEKIAAKSEPSPAPEQPSE